MPREPRDRDPDAFHHVYARGNRRGAVFHDDADRMWFMERLLSLEATSGACHAAHCLMTNHVHLLLRPGSGGVSSLLQRLLGPYTQWFNRRHGAVGHVFQGRFGSRPIESTDDFLVVLRYVHRNPVEAGLVPRAEDWKWSSHLDYLRRDPPPYLRDGVRFARSLFADDPARAVGAYRRFVDVPDDEPQARATGADDFGRPSPGPRWVDGGPSVLLGARAPLNALALRWERRASLAPGTLRGPVRKQAATAARRGFCLQAVEGFGYSIREVAAFLGRSESNTSVLLRNARPESGSDAKWSDPLVSPAPRNRA